MNRLTDFERRLVQGIRERPVEKPLRFGSLVGVIFFLCAAALCILTGLRADIASKIVEPAFISSMLLLLGVLSSFLFLSFASTIPGNRNSQMLSQISVFAFVFATLLYSLEPHLHLLGTGEFLNSLSWANWSFVGCTWLAIAAAGPALFLSTWVLSRVSSLNTRSTSFFTSMAAVTCGSMVSGLHCEMEGFGHRIVGHGGYIIIAGILLWPFAARLLKHLAERHEYRQSRKELFRPRINQK